MTTIFKLVSEAPVENQTLFTTFRKGKKKISKAEIIKVDYCMPGLMRNARGERMPIPDVDISHIPQEFVSNFVTCMN